MVEKKEERVGRVHRKVFDTLYKLTWILSNYIHCMVCACISQ